MINKFISSVVLLGLSFQIYAVLLDENNRMNPVKTTNCLIRSYIPDDAKSYSEIVTNGENMDLYLGGSAFTPEKTSSRLSVFEKRFNEQTPFNVYTIETHEKEAIGFVTIGNGYCEGGSSIGLVTNKKFRAKGLSAEIIPVFKELFNELHQKKCPVNKAPVSIFHASALEVPHINKVMNTLGFKTPGPSNERTMDNGTKVKQNQWYKFQFDEEGKE
jgi:RimJ/RimL family protein N-acetyltransferase